MIAQRIYYLIEVGAWHIGNAFDSRPKDWGFKSIRHQFKYMLLPHVSRPTDEVFVFPAIAQLAERETVEVEN